VISGSRHHDVDVLLCNETEVCSLFQYRRSRRLQRARRTRILAWSRADPRVPTSHGHRAVTVPAHEVEHVIDQNGAGDMFASGFLYGLALVPIRRVGPNWVVCAGGYLALGADGERSRGAGDRAGLL